MNALAPGLDALAGRVQWWLQGHPAKWRPWFAVRIGNWIADLRYRAWRRSHPEDTMTIPTGFAYTASNSQAGSQE